MQAFCMASMLSVWCMEAAGAASQLSSCLCCILQYKDLRGRNCAHCRGYFSISSRVQREKSGHYPGTYLDIGGGKWSKGVAFINGFNLVQSDYFIIRVMSKKCSTRLDHTLWSAMAAAQRPTQLLQLHCIGRLSIAVTHTLEPLPHTVCMLCALVLQPAQQVKVCGVIHATSANLLNNRHAIPCSMWQFAGCSAPCCRTSCHISVSHASLWAWKCAAKDPALLQPSGL